MPLRAAHLDLAIALGLLALLLTTSFLRPILPVDETRYLAVAWEMWQRGDFLVPYLNGSPYSHKPPLLFWLIDAGWALFGVNAWWPRLIPALFAAGSMLLLRALASRLWPHAGDAASIAPMMLVALFLWAWFATTVMFDMMLAFFVLLGCLGLARAWREQSMAGWALFALGLGGGVLSKGPVALIHLMPLAVLAPWWTFERRPGWLWWYSGTCLGLLCAMAIALAWAVPAALAGGASYRHEIFIGQTSGRVVASFAHRQPFWYYLPFLPLITAPWILWPRLWRGTRATGLRESGSRFVLTQLLAALLLFSLVSGKQVQYLLPELTLLTALGARFITCSSGIVDRREMLLPASAILVVGAIALAAPTLLERILPLESGTPVIVVGMLTVAIGIAIVMSPGRMLITSVRALAGGTAAGVAALSAGGAIAIGHAYDVQSIAIRLKALEMQNVPVAHANTYYGQFHFVGRLDRPLAVITEGGIADWLERNPGGRVVVYYRKDYTGPGTIELSQRFRSGRVAIVGAGPLGATGPASPLPRRTPPSDAGHPSLVLIRWLPR